MKKRFLNSSSAFLAGGQLELHTGGRRGGVDRSALVVVEGNGYADSEAAPVDSAGPVLGQVTPRPWTAARARPRERRLHPIDRAGQRGRSRHQPQER